MNTITGLKNDAALQKLDELKATTQESIQYKKKFDYKIGNNLSEKLGDEKDDYYRKYLIKSIGEKVEPKIIKSVKKGEKDDKITYSAMPVHHYNTLLAMAFTKAEKLYSDIAKKGKTESKSFVIKKENLKPDENEEMSPALSAIECLMMSRQLFGGRNASIIKSIKKGDMKELEEFAANEHLWYKVLQELRNFHAHIFHEPGPVSFKNLYGDDYMPAKKLSEAEWAEARDWFQNKFNDVKEHKLKTLNKRLGECKTEDDEKDVKKVIEAINNYKFEVNGHLSREALLFIACMFLRKSDAEYFVKKWTGVKRAEGVYKSTQNFFTENSVKDSKSLLTLNSDIFKYRQMIGILSTMPYLNSGSLKPFYEYINEHNDNISIEAKKKNKKAEKEKLAAFIIPIRKSVNYTQWYLKYLNDNEQFDSFRIAYYKTDADREEWAKYLKDNFNGSLGEFKLKLKQAAGEEKKKLNKVYKAAKRNFVFRKPSPEYDNYCTKKLNAMLQYDFTHEAKTITIQVQLSPDFLMKWAFAHVIAEKGEQVKNDLISYLTNYYYVCIKGEFSKDIKNVPPKKAFPASLINTVESASEKIIIAKIINSVNANIYDLQKFNEENQSKKAPWRFAAKRKIDIILDYVHLVYLDIAYDENKTVDTIRHEALNDTEYLDVFEQIRFYGRYYEAPGFKKIFFEDKKIYFKPLHKAMKQLDSLEGLYNFAINEYLNYLKATAGRISDVNAEKYSKVFKITGKSLSKDIKHHAEMFAVNHSVPHELIRFEAFVGYNDWKKKIKEKEWISDFSFMRKVLGEKGGFSNTDYLMQEIMPVLIKHNKLSLKPDGKIAGNRQMYNSLSRNKTNELMLWEVCKWYWKKATGKEFNKSFKKLVRNESGKISKAFKETNPYYGIFQEELEIELRRYDKDKEKMKNNPSYSIKIKPKKFDDEYQYYQQEHIIDYIENYNPPKGNDEYRHFEELNKDIKNELARYLDDVYLLMTAEKLIVEQNFDAYTKLLDALLGERLPEYHIPFKPDKKIQSTLSRDMFDKLNKKGFTLEDLETYRNRVMHQQLQPNKNKYKLIRKSLIELCASNGLL